MLAIYRQLLRLYPPAYRQQFADEMLAVFLDIRADIAKKRFFAQTVCVVREILGLIGGACGEHLRCFLGPDSGFPLRGRSFVMRNGFRFPNNTAVLMVLILCGVEVAIKKGEEKAMSLPHVNPGVEPLHLVHSALLPPVVLLLIVFYAAGLVGWTILFALRRSGVHRLAELSGEQK